MRLKEKRDELWPVAKQDEIYVRLYIYGSLEVRDAYVKWFRADLSWKKAYAEIEAKDPDADFARKKAYAEIVPEFLNDTTPYSRSQMRERAKKADEATDEAMADLENTIVQAIQREPRSIRTSRRLLGWHASRHDPASR